MSTPSIAVVGAGHLGRIHARLLAGNEHANLHSIVDPCEDARNSLAQQHGVPAFASAKEVVEKIDAAIIAAPTVHHAAAAHAFIDAGKHVLIEKPLASSAEEAEGIVSHGRQQGVVIQSGHCERFNPAYKTLKAKTSSQVQLIECDRSGPYSFRSTDVGVVFDLMIHDIDLALDLVGAEVLRVDAIGGVVIGPNEDWAQARLEFLNGSVAQISACRTAVEASRRWKVRADGFYGEADFASGTLRTLTPGEPLSTGFDPNALAPGEREDWKTRLFDELLVLEEFPGEGNAILEEQRDFVTAFQQSRVPRAAGAEAARAIEIAERVLHQVHRNRSEISPFRRAG